MRMIHLYFLTCYFLASLESRYHFRFYACNPEHQKLLEAENVPSLRQVAFINDGSLIYHNAEELKREGIQFVESTWFHKLLATDLKGSESAFRAIIMNGSATFVMLNFWQQTYYELNVNSTSSITHLDPTHPGITPSLNHFIRVYFVCAPGNSRSALILFGPQSLKRSRVVKGKKSTPKRDKAKFVKLEQRATLQTKTRSFLHLKKVFTWIHNGLSFLVVLNGMMILYCMWKYRFAKPVKVITEAERYILRDGPYPY